MLIKEKLPYIRAKCDVTDNAYNITKRFLSGKYERVRDVYDRALYFISDNPFVAMGNSIEITKIEEKGTIVELKKKEISFYIFVRHEQQLLKQGGIFSAEGVLNEVHTQINHEIQKRGCTVDLLPPLNEFFVSMDISKQMA